jgi:hypothetical protein
MSLHIKLSRTAKALASWDIKQIPLGKLTAIICREIAQLDKIQEDRILSAEETQLKKLLKSRILDLAAIERSRAKQRSRINWIREGDANTKKKITLWLAQEEGISTLHCCPMVLKLQLVRQINIK